jgi:hypothetical protein
MKKVISIFCIVFFFVLSVGFCPNDPEEPAIMISSYSKGGKIIKNRLSKDNGKIGYKKTYLKIDTDSTTYYYHSVRCSGKGLNVCPPVPTYSEIRAMLKSKKDSVSKVQSEKPIPSQ